AIADVRAEINAIAQRRGVTIDLTETQRTPAVACSPRIQEQLAQAIRRAGVEPRFLPSGAGHDAVNFGRITETGMLFVRCGNGGVSHSPREQITSADADIAARVLLDMLTTYSE